MQSKLTSKENVKLKKNGEIPDEVLKRWGWRRIVFLDFNEDTHTTSLKHLVPEYSSYGFTGEWNMWHRVDEITAFRFELLQRFRFHTLPSWPFLPNWLSGWVQGLLAPKLTRAVCAMFNPITPHGYASINDWMWDLTASDDALCKFFISKINEERKAQGLPTTDIINRITGTAPKHGVKRRGHRNRQVSWLAVEAHDLKSYKVRALTDGERSRLSKARREVLDYEMSFRAALEVAKGHTQEKNRVEFGENLYVRFLRENFLSRFPSLIPKG